MNLHLLLKKHPGTIRGTGAMQVVVQVEFVVFPSIEPLDPIVEFCKEARRPCCELFAHLAKQPAVGRPFHRMKIRQSTSESSSTSSGLLHTLSRAPTHRRARPGPAVDGQRSTPGGSTDTTICPPSPVPESRHTQRPTAGSPTHRSHPLTHLEAPT